MQNNDLAEVSLSACIQYVGTGSCSPEKNQELLMSRVCKELTDLLEATVECEKSCLLGYTREIAMKSMIVWVLAQGRLAEETLSELLSLEEILGRLYELCEPIMSANVYEIEDILALRQSFR